MKILRVCRRLAFQVRFRDKPDFNSRKFVTTVQVTNQQPGGSWANDGDNWLSGV